MIYFTAHTFKCVCHSRKAMFRVLGMYNFDYCFKIENPKFTKFLAFCQNDGLFSAFSALQKQTLSLNVWKLHEFWIFNLETIILNLEKVLSNLEPEGQGGGIIKGVTRLLLLGPFYYIHTNFSIFFCTRLYVPILSLSRPIWRQIMIVFNSNKTLQDQFSRDWLTSGGKRFSRDWLTSGGKRFSRDWLTSGGKRSISTSMDTSTCIKKSLETYVNDILTCLSVDATPLNQNEVSPQRGVALRSFLF